MIGWLNEINRLASKGKREHREPPVPPVPPAQRPGPIPGHRAARTCAGLLRILQRTWRQDPWEKSSMTPHSALKGHLPEPSREGEARLLPLTRKPPAPGLSCARPTQGLGPSSQTH